MIRPLAGSSANIRNLAATRGAARLERPNIVQRLLLLSIVLVPLQQAFTIDVGFPLKPSEMLIVLAVAMFPFQRWAFRAPSLSNRLLWGLTAVVVASSGYRLLTGEPVGFVPGFTRSANVDLILYAGYAFLVVLFYSVGNGLTRNSIGRAIVASTWVMATGVLIQLVLGEAGQNDVLEKLNFETKAKGLALDEQSTSGVMRSGPFVEGQHLGFYAAGCILVALAFKKYLTSILAVFCLIYSQSTTGFISLVVGLAVIVLIRPSISLLWKVATIGVAALAVVVSSEGLRTLVSFQLAKLGVGNLATDFSGSNISMDLREVKSIIGFRILGENPVIGAGPGRYGVHFFEHTDGLEVPDYYFSLDDHRAIAENVYAQIGAELGIVGLLLWIFLLYAVRPKFGSAKLPDIALWIGLVIGVGTQSNWTFLPIWVFILYLSMANREPAFGRTEMNSETKPDPEGRTRPNLGRTTHAKRKAYRAS